MATWQPNTPVPPRYRDNLARVYADQQGLTQPWLDPVDIVGGLGGAARIVGKKALAGLLPDIAGGIAADAVTEKAPAWAPLAAMVTGNVAAAKGMDALAQNPKAIWAPLANQRGLWTVYDGAEDATQGQFSALHDRVPRVEIDDSAAKVKPYPFTPAEAFEEYQTNTIIRGSDDISRKVLEQTAPLKNLSSEDILTRWKQMGGEIVAAAENGDMETAKRIAAERGPMDTMLSLMGNRKYGPLSAFFDHPELYKARPDLADMHVRIDPDDLGDARGQYLREQPGMRSEQIVLRDLASYNEENKSTLLHEIQHALQERGGMARGGSPEQMELDARLWARKAERKAEQLRNSDAYKSWVARRDKKLNDPNASVDEINEAFAQAQANRPPEVVEFQNLQDELFKQQKGGLDRYRRLAGEIEARDAASRRNLTPDQRVGTQPYSSENIPLSDFIVRR